MSNEHYDCVIVGAGSAGCVLASRLSANGDRTVLLLESGGDFTGPDSMPAALVTETFRPRDYPEYVWNYKGVGTPEQPDPYAVLRGKVVGGSGAINGANFIRNVPEDFDAWGSSLWNFDAVLPFFRKLESDRDYADDLHGTEGPIPVGRLPRQTWGPFHESFYDGALAVGFPEKLDLSSHEGFGIGPLPRNDITGVRMNAALAYLNPVRSRENLTVRTGETVIRILFDHGRATALEVARGRDVETIEAGEIVLCAGGIESPHILMLSGIGPAAELEQLGLPVVQDLPGVAQNLTDHSNVGVEYAPSDRPDGADSFLQAVALIYTAPDSPYRNDIRLQSTVGIGAQAALLAGDAPPVSKVSVNCLLDRPTSLGRLRVTSSDPTVGPTLEYNYLNNAFDRQRMRDAVRTAVRIVEDGSKSKSPSERVTPTDGDLATDADLDLWLLKNIRTAFHTCGTLRLGTADDDMAVVDDHCRVRGIERLTVADLSIVPTVGRASMMPTAVMIGERVAALLSP